MLSKMLDLLRAHARNVSAMEELARLGAAARSDLGLGLGRTGLVDFNARVRSVAEPLPVASEVVAIPVSPVYAQAA